MLAHGMTTAKPSSGGSIAWVGSNGYFSVAGSTATCSGASGGEALVGQLLPSADCYFDVTLSGGHPSNVNFLGVASGWTPGNTYSYLSAGYSAAYWNGYFYRDGSNAGTLGFSVETGTYRIALRYGSNLMYMQKTSAPASIIAAVALPAGYSASAIRPVLIAQGGYPASPSTTLLGYSIGSGDLY